MVDQNGSKIPILTESEDGVLQCGYDVGSEYSVSEKISIIMVIPHLFLKMNGLSGL